MHELHAEQKMDREIAAILNAEEFRTARGRLFDIKNIWLLRQRWDLPAVKPNGPHPMRGEDSTYSVKGAAEVIGVYPGTIYKWLREGQLEGEQMGKGLPWKIHLDEEQITYWQNHVRRVRRSRKEAS